VTRAAPMALQEDPLRSAEPGRQKAAQTRRGRTAGEPTSHLQGCWRGALCGNAGRRPTIGAPSSDRRTHRHVVTNPRDDRCDIRRRYAFFPCLIFSGNFGGEPFCGSKNSARPNSARSKRKGRRSPLNSCSSAPAHTLEPSYNSRVRNKVTARTHHPAQLQ
jgi:hypothetical protein